MLLNLGCHAAVAVIAVAVIAVAAVLVLDVTTGALLHWGKRTKERMDTSFATMGCSFELE